MKNHIKRQKQPKNSRWRKKRVKKARRHLVNQRPFPY